MVIYTGNCESVGTSTPLFPTLTENINVHLLNNICLPVHKEIHGSEITVNQGDTGTCIPYIQEYWLWACNHSNQFEKEIYHTHKKKFLVIVTVRNGNIFTIKLDIILCKTNGRSSVVRRYGANH